MSLLKRLSAPSRALLAQASLAYALAGCESAPDGSGQTDDDVAVDAADDVTADVADDAQPVEDAETDVADTAVDAGDAGTDTVDVAVDLGGDTFYDPDVPDAEGPVDPGVYEPLELYAIDPATGPVEGGTEIVVVGWGFTVDTDLLINGVAALDVDLVNTETIYARTPANAAGIFDVKVVNPGGQAILPLAFTYVAPLTLDSVDPSLSPERGGVPFSVYGGGFTADAVVTVGGRIGLDRVVVSSQRIDVVAPSGTAGPADVRVTTRAGTRTLAGAFTYYAEPRIDRLVPAAGSSLGGTESRVYGAAISAADAFSYDSLASLHTFESAGSVFTTAPGGAPGATDFTVNNTRGDAYTLPAAFFYVDTAGPIGLSAVSPNSGSTEGGELVTLAGPGVEGASGVFFVNSPAAVAGASPNATIVDSGPGWVVVETPAHVAGSVTVAFEDSDSGVRYSLASAYTYVSPLRLLTVSPDEGDVDGSETVAITGSGFTASTQVYLGAAQATTTFVDATHLTIVTPPGALGTVDVVARDGARSAVLADGYTYDAAPVATAMTPSRGAIAGGTYTVIRGAGFTGDVQVTFNGVAAASVEILDPATLAVVTPPGIAGTAAVEVTVDGVRAGGRLVFVYYDPFSDSFNWWGGPIDGSVNVTVVTITPAGTLARVPEAVVTLNVRASSTGYAGVTNDDGQVTLSGPDVIGVQTVSAAAEGFSTGTVNSVNATNVVIYLTSLVMPPPSDGEPPPGETWPVISGTLRGLDKIVDPAPGEVLLAVIRTTAPYPGGANPEGTGLAQVVYEDGADEMPYEMVSRPGDLAVVALCGTYNELTDQFTPLYMGIQRGFVLRFGDVVTANIECDIPLDEELTFKFVDPPLGRDAADILRATPFLDFGSEGGIDLLIQAEGAETVISLPGALSLDDPLFADVSYFIIGEAVPADAELPFSVTYERNIRLTDRPIEIAPFVPPAELRLPAAPQRRLVDRRFEWSLASETRPDFYMLNVLGPEFELLWEVYLPGDETGFTLPAYPPDSAVGRLPAGELVLIVYAIDAIVFSYDSFDSNNFSFSNWNAYSANGWFFVNP